MSDSDPNKPIQDELHIVGIGTSAGGLEALQALFKHIVPHPQMAYVIVQHLSPDYKSLMVELLSKYTEMPVHQISDGMSVEGGSIYVMPPKHNLEIKGRKLLLKDKPPKLNVNFPIDIFLRTLGEEQMDKAIALILSGTGDRRQ